jgi:hypothetical protein
MVCEKHGWASAAGCPYCYREAGHKDDPDQWAPCLECAEKDERIAVLKEKLHTTEWDCKRIAEQEARSRKDARVANTKLADETRRAERNRERAETAERERDSAQARAKWIYESLGANDGEIERLIDRLKAERDAEREHNANLLDLLRHVEWAYHNCGDGYCVRCPMCHQWMADGHAPDCELAAALKGGDGE